MIENSDKVQVDKSSSPDVESTDCPNESNENQKLSKNELPTFPES